MNFYQISKIVEDLRREIEVPDRQTMTSNQLINNAMLITDEDTKMVVLQLLDYISYISSMVNVQDTLKDEKQMQKLFEAFHMLQKFTKEIKVNMETLRESNTKIIHDLGEERKERKILQRKVAGALRVWSKDDVSFQNEVATEMAEILDS